MHKCKKCGNTLDAVLHEGVIHCECGADNKVVHGQIIELMDNGSTGTWDAPTLDKSEKKGSDESNSYEGKDADEGTVEHWFENYKQYFEIEEVSAVIEAFCKFTGHASDTIIPRGLFKHLWNQFKGQSE